MNNTLLNQMGITTWQAREALPGAKPSDNYQCYALGPDGLYMVVENGANLSADEHELISNMLRSMGFQMTLCDDQAWQSGNHIVILVKSESYSLEIHKMNKKTTKINYKRALKQGKVKRNAWRALSHLN